MKLEELSKLALSMYKKGDKIAAADLFDAIAIDCADDDVDISPIVLLDLLEAFKDEISETNECQIGEYLFTMLPNVKQPRFCGTKRSPSKSGDITCRGRDLK